MRDLTELGFVPYRNVSAHVADHFQEECGFRLPSSYLEFLGFRQPQRMPMAYQFTRADGENWEGMISEFNYIDPNGDRLERLADQVVRSSDFPSRALLPIGCDPGGNWLCLELSQEGPPVVDLDYGTGLISKVAPNFESFLDLLQLIDEDEDQ